MPSITFNRVVAAALLLHAAPLMAFEWRDLWQRKDQQAHALLESGNAEQAAQTFSDRSWRGVSHYKAGNYEQAVTEFRAGGSTQARYNQGVSEVKGGQYEAAIDSFEAVLEVQPDNADAAHNLAIAKALAEQQQQQSQNSESSEGDNQQNDHSSDDAGNQNSEQNNSESNEQNAGESDSGETDESDAQSQQSETSTSESEQSDPAQQEASPQTGELSDEAQEAQANSGIGDEQARDDLQAQLNAQMEESTEADTDAGEATMQVPASESISEENQATEQWLRRIPDDPSQLLRNKIKLNHLLEHPDVGDTAQPW
ncbi:MAG: tetratricopeptide repeat protein [Pseudomonadota bacterium]